MFNPDSVEETVKHIKNLVDNSRCAACDKIDGARMRYACGHTSCEDCAFASVDCPLCLTPQTTFKQPVIDKPLTEKVKNAVNLLNVFQDGFHIDVYKRQRLSEQLKIEKEVFPECIQAPVKYYNKRKSIRNSKHNKENRLSQLPGEEVSFASDKMDQSNVEQWLDKYVRRKPFADLNINNVTLRNPKLNNNNVSRDSGNISIMKSPKKRPYNKTSENQVKSNTKSIKSLKNKRPKIEVTAVKNNKVNNSVMNNDESGIGIDEDDPIVIDDSQSVKVDKDLEALQAVHDAEMHKQSLMSVSRESITRNNEDITINTQIYKVPFFLKSSLSDNKVEAKDKNKDVSITIDNKSFTTTIRVKTIEDTKVKAPKKSVEVQTEQNSDYDQKFVKENPPVACIQNDLENVKDEVKHVDKITIPVNKTQNVIIEESDSDEDLNASVSMTVTAEIHRSCEEIDYGILSGVENLHEHSKRARRAARGHTPASTDSSEKENFNPNRQKKTPSSKKKPTKK